MAIIQILINFPVLNVSVQVGDIIYCTVQGAAGGFDASTLSQTRRIGPITVINGGTLTVRYDNQLTTAPGQGDFISFAKDKTVNTSSLLGYYAQVKFVNNSTHKVELFSVGSEIQESSK
tara:strand:- start:2010 stop:2366 length:357 start_codon:yes stop_codon:yes gene_type:complete